MLIHGRAIVTDVPAMIVKAPISTDAEVTISFHMGMWVHLGADANIQTEEPNESGFHFSNTDQHVTFTLRRNDELWAVVSPNVFKATPTVLCWLISY